MPNRQRENRIRALEARTTSHGLSKPHDLSHLTKTQVDRLYEICAPYKRHGELLDVFSMTEAELNEVFALMAPPDRPGSVAFARSQFISGDGHAR